MRAYRPKVDTGIGTGLYETGRERVNPHRHGGVGMPQGAGRGSTPEAGPKDLQASRSVVSTCWAGSVPPRG